MSAEHYHYCCGVGFYGTCLVLYYGTLSLTSPQAHGYATDEFEVTRERLGVYLPVRNCDVLCSVIEGSNVAQVEHIDNPKGYGDGKDAREVDPGLRPVCIVIEFASNLGTTNRKLLLQPMLVSSPSGNIQSRRDGFPSLRKLRSTPRPG